MRGAIWATCEGWSDWRFETSGSLWSLMRYPERTLFSLPLLNDQGVTLTLADHISAVASSREFFSRSAVSAEMNALNIDHWHSTSREIGSLVESPLRTHCGALHGARVRLHSSPSRSRFILDVLIALPYLLRAPKPPSQ